MRACLFNVPYTCQKPLNRIVLQLLGFTNIKELIIENLTTTPYKYANLRKISILININNLINLLRKYICNCNLLLLIYASFLTKLGCNTFDKYTEKVINFEIKLKQNNELNLSAFHYI